MAIHGVILLLLWSISVVKYSSCPNVLTLAPYRKNGDLKELSADGHFLKGSSATLGLTKIKDSCEKVQHYGARKDEAGNPSNLSKEECLSRIETILKVVKVEYLEAEKALKRFYHDPS